MAYIDVSDLDQKAVIFNLFNNARAVKAGRVQPLADYQGWSWLSFNPGKRTPEQGKIYSAIHLGFTQTTKRGEFNSDFYDHKVGDSAQRIINGTRLLTKARNEQPQKA